MRCRFAYAAAFLGSVAAGLASRRFPWLFPAAAGKYPGDALWALMVFCGVGFFRPGWSTGKLAISAVLISYADEASQLVQTGWLNSIRNTTLGHLVLGSTFSWWDMLAYTVGVGAGAAGNELIKSLFSAD